MKYFFINNDRDVGKYLNNGDLGFLTCAEDIKHYINNGKIKNYIRIPAFSSGDKIKIGGHEDGVYGFCEDYNNLELEVKRIRENGSLLFSLEDENKVKEPIYIVDIKSV